MKRFKNYLLVISILVFTIVVNTSMAYCEEITNEDFIGCDSTSTDCFQEVINYDFISPQGKFASGGPNESHQTFARQALKILSNDKGAEVAKPLNDYSNIILEYVDKPDKDEREYAFAQHFYNPYTYRNFLPSSLQASSITAWSKFDFHLKNSIKNYNKNRTYSMQELGRALHFLEDVNVPHHAANLVAVLSTHSQYEKYINKYNGTFLIESSLDYDKYSDSNFESFSRLLFDECAKYAYSYKDLANSLDKDNWDIAAKATIKKAQENIPALFYRYLKEVN